jgi:hypothetical protein
MWQYIQNSIEAKLSRDMDVLYEKLNRKLSSLTQKNAQQNSGQRGRKNTHRNMYMKRKTG